MKLLASEWLKAAQDDLAVIEKIIFGLLPNGKPTLEDAQEFYRFAKSIYSTVQNTLN